MSRDDQEDSPLTRAERELAAARAEIERHAQDIAQQKEWFRVTLASIGEAVIMTDAQGAITFLNPAAERLTGLSADRVSGQLADSLLSVVDEETRESLPGPVHQVLGLAGRMTTERRTALIRADGSFVAIDGSASPIRDVNGTLAGCMMVFRDVTMRRRAERALRSNEERLRDSARRLQLAMTASDLGDWAWDAESGLLSLSPRAAQVFGLTPNAPVTREQLRDLVPPEDGELTRREFDRALAEHTDYNVEFRINHPSGTSCWALARGRGVYSDRGAVVGMIGVIQDITERRRAEESRAYLAAVVESSSDAIVGKTLDSIITTWNQGAERVFGYEAEEVIGKSIALLIPSDQVDEEAVIIERLKRGERVEHYETVRRHKDGRLIEVSLAVSPIRDSKGRIIGASKIARDISRQKQVEEALLESDRRKDEFLATLAHELRNPLAPIRQAALISQATSASEAQKRWSHEVISRQVRHMALLLDDLLDISRITRGTLALRVQMTDLASIIEAAVETARPALDAKRHAFTLELPQQKVAFAADPMRLSQVLANLLTNAAKYTDPEGRISLVARCDDSEIVIGVTDNGIGIPPEAMGNLFSMFSQVNSSKDRSEGGLGIGLALAKGLVSLHGGHIEARSAGSERGSEFIVRLPLRTHQMRQPSGATASFAEKPLRRRVLIADDNRDAAESLALLLEMEGHEVTVVHDGREAIAAFEKVQPDAALLDIGMPGLNGYEIARHIRRSPQGRDVLLIAVTGWGQDNDKAQAVQAGFNHHFTKPVEPDALAALLAVQPSTAEAAQGGPAARRK